MLIASLSPSCLQRFQRDTYEYRVEGCVCTRRCGERCRVRLEGAECVDDKGMQPRSCLLAVHDAMFVFLQMCQTAVWVLDAATASCRKGGQCRPRCSRFGQREPHLYSIARGSSSSSSMCFADEGHWCWSACGNRGSGRHPGDGVHGRGEARALSCYLSLCACLCASPPISVVFSLP